MYTKLFGSIVHSTIWREPDSVRLVWITMLALSDKKGCVWASIPGLADAARVSLPECEQAIDRLSSPDQYSRTQVAEGRRIEAIDGGWWLINHAKFQEIKNLDERREQVRLAVQRHRSKDDVINVIIGNPEKSGVIDVSPSDQLNSDQPLHTDVVGVKSKRVSRASAAMAPYDALFEEAWALYPRRVGNNKTEAWKQWLKRVGEGIDPIDMLTGTKAYADSWKSRDAEDFKYVKMAKTFYGPERHFHSEWNGELDSTEPIVDEFGCLTAYGERITRPD